MDHVVLQGSGIEAVASRPNLALMEGLDGAVSSKNKDWGA